MQRVAGLDGLRGILALLVVVHHMTVLGGFAMFYPLGRLCVSLFFVMSAYVLVRAWNGHFGKFLLRRFVRLWPVYAVCLAGGYALHGTWPRWSEFACYPIASIGGEAAADPPAWSLCVEAAAMLCMPALVWCARPPWWRLAAGLALGQALALLNPWFGYSIFFLCGAALSRFDLRIRGLDSALPQWLGRISYSLYLSHWLVLEATCLVFGRPGTVLGAAMAPFVAWVLWRLVEWPSIVISRLPQLRGTPLAACNTDTLPP